MKCRREHKHKKSKYKNQNNRSEAKDYIEKMSGRRKKPDYKSVKVKNVNATAQNVSNSHFT